MPSEGSGDSILNAELLVAEPRLARIARIVIAGLPHHVTQRGNRRQTTFFADADYAEYRRLMAGPCARCGTQVWAYCLMPNHVHLFMVPSHADGLRCAVAESHRRYTRMINFRHGWRGHLWQERFHAFVMDECYLLAAARRALGSTGRWGLEMMHLNTQIARSFDGTGRGPIIRKTTVAGG